MKELKVCRYASLEFKIIYVVKGMLFLLLVNTANLRNF